MQSRVLSVRVWFASLRFSPPSPGSGLNPQPPPAGRRYQSDGVGPVVMNAQSAVVDFYHRHSGDELLETTMSGIRFRARPFKVGWARPGSKIATLDVLATRAPGKVHVHFANRSLDRDEPVVVDPRALERRSGDAALRTLRVVADLGKVEANDGWTRERAEPPGPVRDGITNLVVPAGCVAILEVVRRGSAD